MPQENMSSKIGSSPSPSINRVIDNSKNGQAVVKAPAIVNHSFQKTPIKK